MDFPSELKIYQLPGAFARRQSKKARARAMQVCAVAIKLNEQAKETAVRSKALLERRPSYRVQPVALPSRRDH